MKFLLTCLFAICSLFFATFAYAAEAEITAKSILPVVVVCAVGYYVWKARGIQKKSTAGHPKTKIYSGKKGELQKFIRSQIFAIEISELQNGIQEFAQENNLENGVVNEIIVNSIQPAIETALDDGILTDEEEASLDKFLDAYSLTADDIPQRGKELLVRGAIIRDLLEGNVKPRVDASAMPYKVMKGEVPIWGYSNMAVAEVRNVSRFEGGSQGVSVRVAKGLYWRVGKMAAQRVTSQEMKELGTGTVLVTSHHLFYHVGNNAKRIKHDKIFNITPYSDGVIVHMDGASAKPLVLKTDDSWFLANILQNAQNWA